MQKKPLTTIQGYFIGAIVLMHLLFAIYYFTAEEPSASADGTTVELLPKKVVSAAQMAAQQQEVNPQPPEAGHLNLDEMKLTDGTYQVPMDSQWRATLSLDAKMQRTAERLLKDTKQPAGAIVVLDLSTSEVLVLAQRFIAEHPVAPPLKKGHPKHLALRRVAPSASVFKIVSAGALLKTKLSPKASTHYKPAKRRIRKRHLNPADTDPTSTLAAALASSNNGYFAATTDRYLNQDKLYEMANAFGYNDSVRFPVLVEPSLATIPTDRLERARMSAGFWHSHLTPLHAAVIVQTIANRGRITQPRLVSLMTHESGFVQRAPSTDNGHQILKVQHAKIIEAGLRKTITNGTGVKSFKEWPKKLSSVKIFGKTGTLGASRPDRTYTWFVGYTRGTARDVALAVLAINGEEWWRKAPQVAQMYLEKHARMHPMLVGKREKP